jgi:hypothetical protein
MSRAVVTRLAAFALVIAGSFGTAYGIGQRVSTDPESEPHTHSAAAADPIAPAFAVDGYTLVTDATQPSAATLALHVNGPDGKRITEFAENHGSRLHVVLVRPDLSGFQHVHPDIADDGGFVVPIAEPGKWHVVVDVLPVGAANPVALATNVDDEIPVAEVQLPAADDEVTVDGLTITRQGLSFTLSTTEGLEPYLGQPAHLIAIRQGDLAYSHLHPSDGMTGMFMFTGSLTAGTYRLFLQFGYHGEVLTVPFTVVQP